MSERFSYEVLQQAIAAYLPTKTEAEGIAAMRAVLEGHPQDKHGPDPDRMQAVLRDISDLLADAGVPGGTTLAGGVIWLRERAEALRVAVMVEVSNPHQDWSTARANLTRALNEASDGSQR